MADKIIENNQVSIMGKIDTGFTFSHQVFGEGFYTMELLVRRLSDSEDRIPVMVSERLLDITQDYTGQYIEIHGQFRSYNRHEEKHNRLVLSVFAREVNFVEEQDESLPVNQIFRMASRITYHVSAGAEMPDMHQRLLLEVMCFCGEEFRAVNI